LSIYIRELFCRRAKGAKWEGRVIGIKSFEKGSSKDKGRAKGEGKRKGDNKEEQ